MTTELEDMENIYSFNEILKASFLELTNKIFINIDTNEEYGLIWGKYGKTSTLNSIANRGIIEFMSRDNNKINKIYGKDFDENEKKFKSILIK